MPKNKQDTPFFKLVITPKTIFMKASSPKRNTMIIIALLILLGIALFIALNEPELRSKALELVISIIQTVLTFFSTSPKSK